MLTFIVHVGDFFLRIPAQYVGSQVSTDRFDAVARATGEQIATALGGEYSHCEDDDTGNQA
ncbi:hypothetical protein LMG26857_01780 [Achromobacter anxifer]|uniref:hypothetical protein n=1 Tax=Achromobacter anxifer TaxID=1287737 RepID=UPI00155C0A0A|nr:hypothetical protein [Achromobacter anxifer]CAB5512490.1 hypothetical protein LMG26857_01780 [Achromobacter anxifer]